MRAITGCYGVSSELGGGVAPARAPSGSVKRPTQDIAIKMIMTTAQMFKKIRKLRDLARRLTQLGTVITHLHARLISLMRRL